MFMHFFIPDTVSDNAGRSPSHTHGVSSLKHGDYSCKKDVMVDGDIFTYPYYWDSGGSHSVCAVKILHPITSTKNYFEQKILSYGIVCAISIGVVERNYLLDQQPGWNKQGIGYHADDGKLFNEYGIGTVFGPTCTAGDRMGCGVIFEGGDSSKYVKVFFTKNGQQVGNFVEFKRPESGLYPFMGFNSRGEQFQYLGCWQHIPSSSASLAEESKPKESTLCSCILHVSLFMLKSPFRKRL